MMLWIFKWAIVAQNELTGEDYEEHYEGDSNSLISALVNYPKGTVKDIEYVPFIVTSEDLSEIEDIKLENEDLKERVEQLENSLDRIRDSVDCIRDSMSEIDDNLDSIEFEYEVDY